MRLSFDLHLHSCLSPCGDDDMTPANLAGMCALAGLDVVALTDHNTCGNCAAFCRAAEEYGLLPLAGMELCTAEEVHVVCLFPDLEQAEAFSAVVSGHLAGMPNNKAVFGTQVYRDWADNITGEEPLMLAGASTIGIYETPALVGRFGGLCYPAHIDRPSFSLLSNLGLWDPDLCFPLAEVSRNCPEGFSEGRRDLRGLRIITGSDAHYLEQVADPCQWMEVPECSTRAVFGWLGGNQ